MVRGSDSESGDKEPKKYSGSVSRWKPSRIKLKSKLYRKGLWDVVEKGPTATQASPASVTLGNESTTGSEEWYYARRDSIVKGPCSAEALIGVFNNIDLEERGLTGESVYVFHQTKTANAWEPWSNQVSNQIQVVSTLERNMHKLRTAGRGTPSSGTESPVRMINFGGDGYVATPTVSARDRELGQQRPCTPENDRAAYHVLIEEIDDTADSIGESLLLTANNKFEDNESGYELFKWLEERAGCGSTVGGLVDADEIKRKIDDYKLCKGKDITLEELSLGAEKFERMWLEQPKARQGIEGDMFDTWVTKLPNNPFHTSLLPIVKGMNIISNGSVHAEYAQANHKLRAIYADHLKTNPPAKGKGASAGTALLGKGGGWFGGKGKGGKGKGKGRSISCFRCWAQDDHLSGQCSSPPGVCTACSMDSDKARMSCGGEQDPTKCIIKGYRPSAGVPGTYLDRLKTWAGNNNINMVDSSSAPRALMVAGGGYPGGAQTALAASAGFDPNNTDWQVREGMWRPAAGLMMAQAALLAYGGRVQMPGEIDCVVDGGCSAAGCMPTADGLTNLRAPEIPGMFVGNNQWCAATVTGDLEGYCIDSSGGVVSFTRIRHVVPEMGWHLHGETPEFKEHGGVVHKGTKLVLALPNGSEIILLPGDDDMVRIPIFLQREKAELSARRIVNIHMVAQREARTTYERAAQGSAGTALVGVAISPAQADKYLRYHAIMGCQADESMRYTLSNSKGHGPIQVPHDAAAQFNQCNFCNEYKLTAKPHPPSSSRADRFGKRVLFDGSLLDHVPQALAVEF